MSGLADETASSLVDLYARGAASPVEAVTACLERIEATEPVLRATITVVAEQALAAAAASAERYRSGRARPLEGVPYGLKDIVDTAGIRTTGGSRIYADRVPDADADVHTLLRDAGAVLVAKLNTFPFALGDQQEEAFGVTRNPWDPSRITGGSSAGSAAAVAAGQVPLAVGTDTGGSIRLPATWCGITGLKPTYGRVSTSGVMPLAWSLDTVGPMTRSARDAALMLSAMTGAEAPGVTPAPAPGDTDGPDAGVRGLRVGLPASFLEGCDRQVLAAVEEAASTLRELGVQVREVALPPLEGARSIGWTVLLAELAAAHTEHYDRLELIDPLFAEYMLQGELVSARDYLQALRGRALVQRSYREALATVDALLLPGLPVPAARAADGLTELDGELVDWRAVVGATTLPANVVGLPALALPAGFTDTGLPLGIQLMAGPWQEAVCLRLGHAYQQATEHHLRRPPAPVAAT